MKLPVVIDPRYHDAVIFDMDGVVTDTASIHAKAWRSMFDDFLAGRPEREGENHALFTEDDYRHFVDGKPRHDGVADFLASRGITLDRGDSTDAPTRDTVCGLGNRKQEIFRRLITHGVPKFDSTVALIRRLQDAGLGTGLYSASRNCEHVLDAADIGDLFLVRVDGVIAAELGLPGKPDPAVLLETARRLQVHPDRCVIVEDAEAGVTAGRNGGFGFVLGVDRTGQDGRLTEHGADAVVTDLADVTVRSGDRRLSTLPDALRCRPQLKTALTFRRALVLLDFDGTLSPISDDPASARPLPGVVEALTTLAERCDVAVLSGRDLADVRARVGIDGIWYAGSHGLELCGPDGTRHENDSAAPTTAELERVATDVRDRLKTIDGVIVEHKRFAVAVHYRNVHPKEVGGVLSTVHEIARSAGLRVTPGRKVIEIQPDIDWDKAKTVAWILELIDGAEAALLPIYVGDNVTDEDGFDAVRYDGIGIAVASIGEGDRSTAAQFVVNGLEAVLTLIERLADDVSAEDTEPTGPWSMTFEGYDPDTERLREALCAVGNGYTVARGCAPESQADDAHYPGTYVAGLYNRLSDEISGQKVENESVVNLPNWLPLTFRINGGPWFDIDHAEVLSYRQWLDLRRATLHRRFRIRDTAARTTTVTQSRFVSMHDCHAMGLQMTVEAENWSGTIEFRSLINGTVQNTNVERYRDLSSIHLTVPEARSLTKDSVLLTTETNQSHNPVAVAARTTVWSGETPCPADYLVIDEDGQIGHQITAGITAGQAIAVEKIATIFTGRDHAISEPAEEAVRFLHHLGRYQDLHRDHAVAWAQLWERFDVELDENPDTLRVIRLHTLHLLQTVSPHSTDLDVGVPARGLHGEAYRGHVFWDALFVAPVLNLRQPGVSRALLDYRYRRLPEARRAARDAGFAGAMFPWQSGSSGREESQRLHLNPRSGRWNPDPSYRAHHVSIAIAYNIWQLYQVTGDVGYLIDSGGEMLLDIARFWVSLARFDDAQDRFVIRGVIGPDEFHSGYPGRVYDGIDNNAYTNVMAVWVIARALEALELMPLRDRLTLLEALDIGTADLANWDEVSRRMFVPFHDGVISQFEGYEHLAELDWDAYRQRYGNIQRLDRILEAEDDDVNNYKASKQADVLMLLYLLSADELRELFTRLGYRFSPEQIPRTIEYYLARTSQGSTLSAVVHAWVLARSNRGRALEYFQQVLDSDVADIQGGTTPEGIHIAAMAGSIDLLQRCSTGLETRADRLVIGPLWPEKFGGFAFPIEYRGHRVNVRVAGRTATLSTDPGNAPPITIECRGRLYELAAGSTIQVQ
jgi:trehalose-phosphatase